MKKLYFFVFLIFTTNCVFAQKSGVKQKNEKPCDCSILDTDEKGYFINEKAASELMNRYLKALSGLSKIKPITDPFVIKEAICESPVSITCETTLPNGRKQNVRLILYNNYFLKRISQKDSLITLVDKHVILHEIGHHALGHHKNARNIEALNVLHKKEIADPKLWSKYGADNPMAMELEADIYAIWALSKLEKGFSVSKFIEDLKTSELRKLDAAQNAKNGDHPLFDDRIETMIKFEAEMKRRRNREVARKYFADVASAAYLALWPESYVYDVSISAGSSLAGSPDFSVDGQKTDAFLYSFDQFANYHVGLSVSRFRWDKPLQTELDIQYSQHKYGTTINGGNGDELAETLKLNYLTFCPKLTWSSIGASKQTFLRSQKVGLVASLGINARLPIGNLGYTNFISSSSAPKAAFSVGPKVSVGVALVKKSFLARSFKVLFSYDPQWIRLQATPKPKAISHNLECTLQYAIFRK